MKGKYYIKIYTLDDSITLKVQLTKLEYSIIDKLFITLNNYGSTITFILSNSRDNW